ncbi:MAG: MFS transporter [Dehalococcoidia bacterium]|nr:MFS transporter [Dehalococcoidia bacterium]
MPDDNSDLTRTATTQRTAPRIQAFSALRHRNFRLYWLSGIGQSAALGMQFLILGWLALELTDSAAQLGIVIAIYGVPNLAMLTVGGIFADRVDRRWLLFVSRILVMALILLVATLAALQLITIWHIYGIALVLGTVQGLNMPAQMAIVPDLVDGEDILNATSLNMAVFNTGRIMAPALAGLIIEYAGMGYALFLNAACYGVSCVFLVMLRDLGSSRQAGSTNVMRDLGDGIRFAANSPIAFTMIGLSFVFGFFGASYVQVLPAFGREVLNMNADGAGFLLTVTGVGSLVGNLVIASFGDFRGKNMLLLGMIFTFGITLLLFALTPIYLVSLALLFLTGVGFTGFISVGTTILQITTPPQLRGRMMSFWLNGAAMHYIGALPLGYVGENLGWSISLSGGALAMMGVVLWLGVIRSPLRRLKV